MFLQKLDYLMEERNINKNILSKGCNIPYTTIDGFYKKGCDNVKLSTLRKLSEYFNVDLNYWVSDSVIPKIHTIVDIEKEFIKKYRVLDDMGKHTVHTVLNMEYNRCKNNMVTLKIASRNGDNFEATVNGTEADEALKNIVITDDDF